MKTTVTRSKPEQAKNSGTIKITGLTKGEMLALVNALALRSIESDVCMDVYHSICAGLETVWPKVLHESVSRDEAATIARSRALYLDTLTKLGRTAADARGVRYTGVVCGGGGIEGDILACTEAMKRERAMKG